VCRNASLTGISFSHFLNDTMQSLIASIYAAARALTSFERRGRKLIASTNF
jgi:hypothetical protein